MPRSHQCPSTSTNVITYKVATLRKSTVVGGSLAVTWVDDPVMKMVKDIARVAEPDVVFVPTAIHGPSPSPAWRVKRCRVDLAITTCSPTSPKQARSDILVHGTGVFKREMAVVTID